MFFKENLQGLLLVRHSGSPRGSPVDHPDKTYGGPDRADGATERDRARPVAALQVGPVMSWKAPTAACAMAAAAAPVREVGATALRTVRVLPRVEGRSGRRMDLDGEGMNMIR